MILQTIKKEVNKMTEKKTNEEKREALVNGLKVAGMIALEAGLCVGCWMFYKKMNKKWTTEVLEDYGLIRK